MTQPTRRRFLTTAALAAAATAGCVSGSNGSGDTAETTADENGVGSTGTDSAGATAQGLTLDTIDVRGSSGETLAVQPSGSVVLLDFFATWCAPCKPQMDSLRSVNERFPDVHMLSITWEKDASAIKSFWKEYEGTWPVASDPELKTGEEYGVDRIPTLVVFDPDGEQVWRHTGLAAESDIVENLQAAGASPK